MDKIGEILSKLAGKSGSFEKKEYLRGIWRIAEQTFDSRFEVAAKISEDAELGLLVPLWTAFVGRFGGEPYGMIGVQALREVAGGDFNDFLQANDASSKVWGRFEEICRGRIMETNESVNKGVIDGLVGLAREHPNVTVYLKNKISENLEEAFLVLVAMRGIGPKVASLVVRDIAWLYDMESQIPAQHGIYLQPVDRWVRRVARCLWPELDQQDAPDWVIAKRISEKCAEHGVSGIQFNHGAWFFGAVEVKDSKMLCQKLQEID